MTISKTAEYALLADNVYWDVRSENNTGTKENPDRTNSNWTPVPTGWKVLPEFDRVGSGKESGYTTYNTTDGFSARVFQRDGSNEIVISYAGTFPSDLFGDWKNNIYIALGIRSQQINQAALLYHAVKKAYGDDANITFTGHSLGGGLASVMGVWFDKPAYGFDPAPFKQAA